MNLEGKIDNARGKCNTFASQDASADASSHILIPLKKKKSIHALPPQSPSVIITAAAKVWSMYT